MTEFLSGASAACAAIAGLFFFRFWRDTRDRLFVYFACAFWLLGASWMGLGLSSPEAELRPLFYGVRLVAFVLILAAVVQKNRDKR